MKSHPKTIRSILWSTVAIVLVASGLLLFLLLYSDKELHRTILSMMEETATQQQEDLNRDFETAEHYLLSVADAVEGLEETQDISTFLTQQQGLFSFEGLYVLDLAGNITVQHGKTTSFNDILDRTAVTPDDVLFSKPYLNTSTGNQVILLQTALLEEGKQIGWVVGEYNLNMILAKLSVQVEESEYALIADKDGSYLLATDEEFIPFEALAESTLDNVTTQEILTNLAQKQSGFVSFTLDGIDRIAMYKPLSVNHWSLVLVGNEHVIAADIRMLSTVMIVCLMIAGIIVMLFVVYSINNKKALEYIAYYDELTGLPNFAHYKKHMEATLKANPTKSFVAIKMDVANFKAINEMFTFEIGNQVLHAFAKTAATVPEPSFLLARIGDDEFMMFSGNGFLEQLDQMTDQYEDYFKKTIPALKNHHFAFNYGRYFIEPGESDVNDIITKTSLAHSIAKSKKDGRIWNYDHDYKNQILQLAEITNKMEFALETGEFVPYLQPKFSLKNNSIVGAEALVRWIEADGAMIFPDVFIPLFESNNFIIELDKHILGCVCRALRDSLDQGHSCVPISVNFSRMHLYNKNFVMDISAIVDRYQVPHRLIEVELTETTVLDHDHHIETFLADLHTAGFAVSIDDFGAGYSSLGLLKNFKADTLKLDRSFLVNNSSDQNQGDLVIDAIIKLAHSIDMSIVAEGVEEESQVHFLRDIDCDVAQGYFFARPMPIDEFKKRYMK